MAKATLARATGTIAVAVTVWAVVAADVGSLPAIREGVGIIFGAGASASLLALVLAALKPRRIPPIAIASALVLLHAALAILFFLSFGSGPV